MKQAVYALPIRVVPRCKQWENFCSKTEARKERKKEWKSAYFWRASEPKKKVNDLSYSLVNSVELYLLAIHLNLRLLFLGSKFARADQLELITMGVSRSSQNCARLFCVATGILDYYSSSNLPHVYLIFTWIILANWKGDLVENNENSKCRTHDHWWDIDAVLVFFLVQAINITWKANLS